MKLLKIFCLVLVLFLTDHKTILAIYAPGETLDPSCLPTDSDCKVSPLAVAGSNSSITSLLSLNNFSIVGSTTAPSLISSDVLASFTGNLIDLKIASTSKFTVNNAGGLTLAGGVSSSGTTTSSFAGPVVFNNQDTFATTTEIGQYNIVLWGDSFTAGMTPEFAKVTKDAGVSVDGQGIGGQGSAAIAQRMLSVPQKFNSFNVLWVGRNSVSDPSGVQTDVNSMISALTDPKKFVILSVMNASGEGIGHAFYTNIMSLNNYMATTYPDNYLDVRAHIMSSCNAIGPSNTTGWHASTTQDLIDCAADVPPSSLRVDATHYSETGYRIIAEYLWSYMQDSVYEEQVNKPLSLKNIGQMFLTPPKFGSFDIHSDAVVKMNNVSLISASTTLANYFFGDSAGNTVIATGTMRTLATGINNVGLGTRALFSLTSGIDNTATGVDSLRLNTTGSYNTGNGLGALYSNTTGGTNTAMGMQALYSNTTGSSNTATGFQSLYTATSTNNNSAYGANSLRLNTLGANSSAFGVNALTANTTGSNNTAYGYNSLGANTTASNNTAYGNSSLSSNTSGTQNLGVGPSALGGNTTGSFNTAFGWQSLLGNTTGANNLALGYKAGYGDGTADQRTVIDTFATFIGYQASRASSTASTTVLTNITAIGKNARAGASNTLVLGGTGADAVNVGIGTTTPWRTLTVNGSIAVTNLTANSGSNYALCINNVTKEITADVGGACNPSSARFKNDIKPLNIEALNIITALKPSSYTYSNTSYLHYGLIAEEAVIAHPQLVTYEEDRKTPHGLDTNAIMALLIKGIQELSLRLQQLAENGIANIKSIVTDKLTTNLVITDGIQIRDKSTNQVYCVTIKNGDFDKQQGVCDSEIEEPKNSVSTNLDTANTDTIKSNSDSNQQIASSTSSEVIPIGNAQLEETDTIPESASESKGSEQVSDVLIEKDSEKTEIDIVEQPGASDTILQTNSDPEVIN